MKSLFYKTILSGIFAGSFIFADAQKADAKSAKILDAAASNYKSKKNIYFKFSLGTGENGKVQQTQTGTFYAAASKYNLKIMGIEQISDGSKVYNISAEDQEITIAKAENSEMIFSPINYLNSYKKDYNTTYVGKKNVNGTSVDLMKLIPAKNNGVKQVYIYVNSAKNQIVKIEQYAADNSISIISVTEYKENQTLNPSLFIFNKNNYKNYIITEL
ncbi:MAG: outer membrane lipoprotein carrier protein LolA [Flavobacteriaceae bacterium]|jgi:outer membrane lipoprotein-sorting protein|nr:outer membrane lipoprotein carrier protein LolA [Flavobacteriaceae bacterium]